MHRYARRLGAHADPPQGRIEVTGFGLVCSCVDPGCRRRRRRRIQCGEGVSGSDCGGPVVCAEAILQIGTGRNGCGRSGGDWGDWSGCCRCVEDYVSGCWLLCGTGRCRWRRLPGGLEDWRRGLSRVWRERGGELPVAGPGRVAGARVWKPGRAGVPNFCADLVLLRLCRAGPGGGC